MNQITLEQLSPHQALAIQLAKRDVPMLVCDAVNLEGIAMTLPEVQTILDGITVGGHKISDQNITINQSSAWQVLFEMVKNGQFVFNKETALAIHKIAAKEEALEWGPEKINSRSGYVTISGSEHQPLLPTSLKKPGKRLKNKLLKQTVFTTKRSVLFY
ncbi:hypothetical protein [Pelagibaculum spongiae]|uniref:hypothetical protein n=1 Tax=Pelagibaculum spongiae TaxID=2080658 RepID=UPI001F4E0C9A|nr:hypothetical protein [Pelagibaculum spongiae]